MEQETWNMATATLKRFDRILIQCSYMAQTRDLIGWFNVLMDLRRNIFPFMPTTDWDIIEKKFEELPNDWRVLNNKINMKHFAKVHKLFDDIYMLYVKTMKDKGLLMPKSVDSSKAIIDY